MTTEVARHEDDAEVVERDQFGRARYTIEEPAELKRYRWVTFERDGQWFGVSPVYGATDKYDTFEEVVDAALSIQRYLVGIDRKNGVRR